MTVASDIDEYEAAASNVERERMEEEEEEEERERDRKNAISTRGKKVDRIKRRLANLLKLLQSDHRS